MAKYHKELEHYTDEELIREHRSLVAEIQRYKELISPLTYKEAKITEEWNFRKSRIAQALHIQLVEYSTNLSRLTRFTVVPDSDKHQAEIHRIKESIIEMKKALECLLKLEKPHPGE